MFWVRNKENNFPICTLIWRPGPLDGDVNWMSPLQGRLAVDAWFKPTYEEKVRVHPLWLEASLCLHRNFIYPSSDGPFVQAQLSSMLGNFSCLCC